MLILKNHYHYENNDELILNTIYMYWGHKMIGFWHNDIKVCQ
jgi:hypothetical protein